MLPSGNRCGNARGGGGWTGTPSPTLEGAVNLSSAQTAKKTSPRDAPGLWDDSAVQALRPALGKVGRPELAGAVG